MWYICILQTLEIYAFMHQPYTYIYPDNLWEYFLNSFWNAFRLNSEDFFSWNKTISNEEPMKSFLTVYWAHIIQILNQSSHIVVIFTYIHTYLLTYLFVCTACEKTKIICITPPPFEYENRIHLLTFSSFLNNLFFKKT